MLKPSDFNNAVPQFQNGNYASNPINPQYVEEPSSTDYNHGVEPLQTLPAQWWNWFVNKFTSRFNKVNIYVKNLFNELAQLLSLVNVTPDGTEGAVTDGQLKNAFKELYPTYVSNKLNLGTTYVHQTTEVNGHALSSDITVTKGDVGLDNVVNTGDSATPIENGTTKFTTGGAYTELNKKVDKSSVTSSVTKDDNNPVTSGGVYNALYKNSNYQTATSSVKYYKISSLGIGTSQGFQSKLFVLTERRNVGISFIELTGNGGGSSDFAISVKVYGLYDNNARIYYENTYSQGGNWNGFNLYVRQTTWSGFVLSQLGGSTSNFVIEEVTEADLANATEVTRADVKQFLPNSPSTDGNYALQCNVASGVPSFSWDMDTTTAVPSDATLHYSFDDVPDIPDGTASYRKNNDFTDTEDWSTASDNVAFSVVNSCLKMQSAGTSTNLLARKSMFTTTNLASKIVKVMFRASFAPTMVTFVVQAGNYPTYALVRSSKNGDEYTYCGYLPSDMLDGSSYFVIGASSASSSNYVVISQFYIGDGSYSTPIIDNSGDNINAVNNGGIAVQGVCGKGVYFPSSLQTIAIPTSKIPAPTSNDDFTISCWLMKGSNYTNDTGSTTKGVVRIGANAGLIGIIRNGNQLGCEIRDSSGSKIIAFTASNNVLYHIVAVLSGTTHTMKLYVDGILKGETGAVSAGFQFGSGNTQWTIWGNSQVGGVAPTATQQPAMLDDVMFFSRALSADEVQAIYLNKANTPKFYNLNNYLLDNRSAVPAENGTNLFTTGGAYTLQQGINTLQQDINGRAPIDHASSLGIYGVASSSNYGHVKLGDTISFIYASGRCVVYIEDCPAIVIFKDAGELEVLKRSSGMRLYRLVLPSGGVFDTTAGPSIMQADAGMYVIIPNYNVQGNLAKV